MLAQSAEYKRFVKLLTHTEIRGLVGTELFRKFLEVSWSLLSGDPVLFHETADVYTFEEGKEFRKIFDAYVDCAEAYQFQDILGEAFQEIDAKSVRAGQFFTPWPLAKMMAMMTIDFELFEKQDRVRVHDPACGSGVMLLAAGAVVYEKLGVEGLNKLQLYGQDIDIRCVNMCKIQLRVNGLDRVGRIMRLCSAFDSQAPDPVLVEVAKTEKAITVSDTPPDPSKAVQLTLF